MKKDIKIQSNELLDLYKKYREDKYIFCLGTSDALEKILNDNIKKFDYEDIDTLFDLTLYRINGENVSITKDNIHLYYEFMSEDDLRKFIIKLENEFSDTQDNELMDIIDLLEIQLQIIKK